MNRFEYTEYTAKNVELPNGNIRWEPTGSVTRKYDWEVKEGKIIVNGKWMRIENAPDFEYGLRKTKIKSRNLEQVLNKLIHHYQGEPWQGMADHVLNWVVEHGKEVWQNTTYKQLSVNKRINIKSHYSLPMAYLYKEGLLNVNVEKAFGDQFVGGMTARAKACEPVIDHRKFGVSVESERCKKLLARFSKIQ